MRPKLDVAECIRTDIVAGHLVFGARVTIDQLATRYKISHMPVREALRQLAGEGILVLEPNKGATVREINTEFVSQIMDMRAGIESHLTRRAARRATATDITCLREIESELESAIEHKLYDEVLVHNQRFHGLINQVADSVDGANMVDRHWMLITALWRVHGHSDERFAGVASDHQHLIAALESGDEMAAELLMGAHVMKSKQMLIKRMLAADAPVVNSGMAGG
ncbi:GntR family transcriptional regulator [Granulosicoccus antarcticus]|uniref:HTH-type transcriptional repressor RspR n=1 Tax=Granulosicoccus antarcticus IMCC3135 TaxID=1192854 RepID=A0A2Z2NRC8_9GAMM|nr:GntR family transcriptional regulator [Granulosicoccus antarcticus]ASJ73789.1 HTH-type transcriptional repressor RspR [Granulosicoccus antarcticus IMCC3135]